MNIVYWPPDADNAKAIKFLKKLPNNIKAKFLQYFEETEKNDLDSLLKSKVLRKMSGFNKYNLYEYREKDGKVLHRLFCCKLKNEIVLLNGFQKHEGEKTPKREIETAINIINNEIGLLNK
jgi:phage-related protein